MSTAPRTPAETAAPLRQVLLKQRPLYIKAAVFSFINGILMLAPSWFMFEVYGRVLNSRNTATLWWLVAMVVGVYVVIECISVIRARILHRAAEASDAMLRGRVFDAAFEANLRKLPLGNTQVFGDLKTLREFSSSAAVSSILDVPGALLYLILMFLMSPWLGVMTLVGGLIQLLITLSTDRRTMPLLTAASQSSNAATMYASSSLRNAQVIESMGMLAHIRKRWQARQLRFLALQGQASDYAGLNATAAKMIQTAQGSLLLGLACWLVLHNALFGGAGMMIMASIIGAKALQPLAQLIAQWRSVVGARDAFRRLNGLMVAIPERPATMPLPAPKGLLTVEAVVASAPGGQAAILKGLNFAARPGEMLMILGASASGKSTLARLMVGVWPTSSGKVRLDGADVHAWNKAELGPHMGYLPQAVELFDGTVAENIARFGDIDMQAVQEAVQMVGMQDIIEQLPAGYDTLIGEDGAILSGGQRQRLGLARAIYRSPRLLVLDEPNASLDESGDRALMQLLQTMKSKGSTVIVISHRTNLLPISDKLLVLNEGQAAMFGPRDDVLAALKKGAEQARAQAQAQAQAQQQKAAPSRMSLSGGAA